MPISFHTANIRFSLKKKKELTRFILAQIKKSTPAKVNLRFIFCSDEYLLRLNQKFLNHDYYTDIITFPLEVTEHTLEAEIYISIERVLSNSSKFKVQGSRLKKRGGSPKQSASVSLLPWEKVSEGRMRQGSGGDGSFDIELRRIMFHGVLHLLGYKDKTKAQKAKMRKAEDEWLSKF